MIYVLYVLGALLALILLVVLIGALRPSDFRTARSLLVGATPDRIFPYINSLKRFQEWNPFKDRDPAARLEFSGPEEGPGARFHWIGNPQMGEGIMTIVSATEPSKVTVDLQFIKPFAGHNQGEFVLESKTDGTLVTWSMSGKYALIPRIMGLFINMDKMIGRDFETGLQRLKVLTEATSR